LFKTPPRPAGFLFTGPVSVRVEQAHTGPHLFKPSLKEEKRMKRLMTTLIVSGISLSGVCAGPAITVDASQPGAAISPAMYGIFFEDINFAADGGLYAELVKNRSFEFDRPLLGWTVLKDEGIDVRTLPVRNEERPRNPRFLRVQIDKQGSGAGLNNEGFRGMGVKKGVPCRFSIQARQFRGDISAIRAELIDPGRNVLAKGRVTGVTKDWQTLECELTPEKTEPKATLNIWFEGEGAIDIDMVSLFPSDTWKGRANMLRADLVQLLADMKPGFLRFPGGCIVEGFDLPHRYQWKNTVGDIDRRVVTINRWNSEFKHRPAPDYYQSFGLGFYEYFLLSEDIGAEPMPIINCGMACQFNSGEVCPLDELGPYIQDALDLIEFANGPVDSPWGKLRADMGHPEPFHLKMIGIGNEQWGSQYIERYVPFVKAIKDKHPDISVIAATGSDSSFFPSGEAEIDYLWKQWRKLQPEFVDEHFYRKPEWFIENTHRYDRYDRNGPKLFAGEYAAQSVEGGSPDNRNTLKCALYEAAFMTGMERNADLVRMTCYAPLFGHEEAWQWRPSMIWFDNLNAFGSANYHVQKLFSLNKGTDLLDCTVAGAPQLNEKSQVLHASAVLDRDAGRIIIKAVNVSGRPLKTSFDIKTARIGNTANVITLSSGSLEDANSLEEPDKIVPVESTVKINGPQFDYELKPDSLTILNISIK
jgi:alpha-N-arabinofuranosidase